MPVDFSSYDFKLVDLSVKAALQLIYPHASRENIKELNIKNCLKVFSELADQFTKTDYQFLNIPKNLNDTYFKRVNGLKRAAKNLKIFLFKNEKNITVYFYPRRFIEKKKDTEIVNASRPVIKIDLDLELPAESTFRVATQTFSKILLETAECIQHSQSFKREINNLRKFNENRSLATLFHHITYSYDTNDLTYMKFCMFQERYNKTLRVHSPLSLRKNIKRYCISLTSTLNELHKDRLCHNRIEPESFVLREINGIKKFALINTISSVHLKRKTHFAICRNKPLSLSSYESIKHMIENHSCIPLMEGLPSDVWGLGCTLFKLLSSRTPNFVRFACLAPELNYVCHLLNEKTSALFEEGECTTPLSDALVAIGSVPKLPSLKSGGLFIEPPFLKEILEDWRNSSTINLTSPDEGIIGEAPENIAQRTITPSSVKLDGLNTKRDRAAKILSQIDPSSLGKISDGSQTYLIDRLEKHIEFLYRGIQSILFDRTLFNELNDQEASSETLQLFQSVCNSIFIFNQQFIDTLYAAEENLSSSEEIHDPLLELLRRMLMPNPADRITTREALSHLKKSFPNKYEAIKKETKYLEKHLEKLKIRGLKRL